MSRSDSVNSSDEQIAAKRQESPPPCERPPWHPNCYWPNCKCGKSESAATTPEIARLRAVIEQAVTEFCALAEERQAKGDQEMADRIWGIANEYLEIPVSHGR